MIPIHVCVVGTGAAAARHVQTLRALGAMGRLDVVSRTKDRAAAFAKQQTASGEFVDLDRALTDKPELVVIATPPVAHFPAALQSLRAGVNVAIEKPATVTVSQLDALIDAATSESVQMFVAENQHYAPQSVRLRSVIRRGVIGEPTLVTVRATTRNAAATWRSDPDQTPFGPLHEGGVHDVRRLLGVTAIHTARGTPNVRSVFAAFWKPEHATQPGESAALVTATHGCGALSQLTHSWAIPRLGRFARLLDSSSVIGPGGRILFDGGRTTVVLTDNPRSRRVYLERRDTNGYLAMWRDFVDSLGSGKQPDLSMEDIRDDLAYVDAAYRSSVSGNSEIPLPRPTVENPQDT